MTRTRRIAVAVVVLAGLSLATGGAITIAMAAPAAETAPVANQAPSPSLDDAVADGETWLESRRAATPDTPPAALPADPAVEAATPAAPAEAAAEPQPVAEPAPVAEPEPEPSPAPAPEPEPEPAEPSGEYTAEQEHWLFFQQVVRECMALHGQEYLYWEWWNNAAGSGPMPDHLVGEERAAWELALDGDTPLGAEYDWTRAGCWGYAAEFYGTGN